MQAYAGQAKESNTATGESESGPPTIQFQPRKHPHTLSVLIQADLTRWFQNTNIGSETNITSCTDPHIEPGAVQRTNPNLNFDSVQSTTTATSPLADQIALSYS